MPSATPTSGLRTHRSATERNQRRDDEHAVWKRLSDGAEPGTIMAPRTEQDVISAPDLIVERTKAGLRQPMYDAHEHTVQEIADVLGISRPTVYRHLTSME